jgi:inner membrane protein
VKPGALKYYVTFALLCSVLPDFDLLYFYLIDHRQHAHHTYWTHIPLFWLLFTVLLYFGTKAVFKKNIGLGSVILLANTQLHMVLDSVAGGIYWLYPFNSENYRLFEVTARFDWWVLNYIIHWTFLCELLIIAAATYVMWEDKKTAQLDAAGQYDG